VNDTLDNRNILAIPFGRRFIGAEHPVIVIAEIGINHEGDASLCTDMVHAAAEAGADAVKLQTIDADENYVKGTESYKLFKRSALTPDQTADVFELAASLGVEALTTVGDVTTLSWVEQLNPAAHKISSGLLTHLPMIAETSRTGRTIIMSTGMANDQEITDAVTTAEENGAAHIALFQCTSNYPTPAKNVNLRVIQTLRDRFKRQTGFSDHTAGTEAAPLAVAAGAVLIEKHFTLDRSRVDFDHRLSLEPDGFKEMVKEIRQATEMLGTADKTLSQEEAENRKKYQRCLVARTSIRKGEHFTPENLGVKRPLPEKRGLAPKEYETTLGKTAIQDINADDPVSSEMIGKVK
jgi:N,N'-diacetyllegionaminate synthase